MEENNLNKLELAIKETELEKIKSENLRVQLDIEKFKRENSKKWYNTDYFFKVIGLVFVILPSIWFLWDKIIVPTSRVNELENELNYKKAELEFVNQRIELSNVIDKKEKDLKQKEKEYLNTLLLHEAKNQELQKEISQLKKQYSSENQLTFKKLESYQKDLVAKQKKVLDEISSLYVTMDLSSVSNIKRNINFPQSEYYDFQGLLDFIYLEYLKKDYEPYAYGKAWVIKNDKNQIIRKQGDQDSRSLKDVGIFNGRSYEVVDVR